MGDAFLSRRAALRGTGVLAAVALSGCSTGDGGGDGTPTTDGGSTDGGTGTGTPADTGPVALRTVADGFQAPLDLTDPPGTDRLYVADQTGVISAVGPDGDVEAALDLRERVVTDRPEQGLLGLALHPQFEENRRLYVRYSAATRPGTPSSFSHTFVLAEFEAAGDGSIDPDSERTVMELPQPQWNHNAGSIAFGPDDLLYVGVGDGGGAGDQGEGHADDWYDGNPGGNGQDVTDNLLGSILRIDVDGRESDRAYGIPEDNPLVGEVGLDEHYAWGLRNPWRFSFDGEDCYVADVGQDGYEEVNLLERGGNYGWNVREGAHCFGASECPTEAPDGEPLLDPIVEYPHSGAEVSGISIIGGYVYRGDALPDLDGRYVFGDLNVRGRLFVADRPDDDEGLWPTSTLPIVEEDQETFGRLLSFGQDRDGRLYALGTGADGGGVHELVSPE